MQNLDERVASQSLRPVQNAVGEYQRSISASQVVLSASTFDGVGLYSHSLVCYRSTPLPHARYLTRVKYYVNTHLVIMVAFGNAAVCICCLKGSFAALNERVQHDLQDMEREFQLEKERKQLQVMRGLLRKAFPDTEV